MRNNINADPRNPMFQYAVFIKKTTGVRQLGAVQAEDFTWVAKVIRMAYQTWFNGSDEWKKKMTWEAWVKIWLKTFREMEVVDN